MSDNQELEILPEWFDMLRAPLDNKVDELNKKGVNRSVPETMLYIWLCVFDGAVMILQFLLCYLVMLPLLPLWYPPYALGRWLAQRRYPESPKLIESPEASDAIYIQELEMLHTSFGPARRIKLRRYNGQPISWNELYNTYKERYPDKWAVQMLPPVDRYVDEANMYHLFVLKDGVEGVDISRRCVSGDGGSIVLTPGKGGVCDE